CGGGRWGGGLLALPDELHLAVEDPLPLGTLTLPRVQALERFVHGGAHHAGIERGSDGLKDGAFEDGLRQVQIVPADLGAALPVVGAAVEEPSPPTMMPAHGDHGAAADATPKPAQQVGGGLIEAWGPGAGNARLRPAREGLPPLRHLPMGRVP